MIHTFFGAAAITLAILVGGLAHAAPALPENILCGATHVFAGKIVDVKSRDCRLESKGYCSPPDKLQMRVEVGQVFRTSIFPEWALAEPGHPRQITSGHAVHVVAFAFSYGANRYPALLVEQDVPDPMTTDWIRQKLLGKELIFNTQQPSEVVQAPSGPVHALYGGLLPLEGQQWVRETLAARCK